MKSFHTTIICAVLGLAIFLPCAGAAENPAKQSDVNTAMRDTVIAGTDLSGFSASDMINYLQWMARRHKLNIIVKNECATWETRSGKLSLQTGNISFRELADKVSTTTQTLYRISGNDLIFYPRFHPECGKDPIISNLVWEDITLNDSINFLQIIADKYQLGIKVRNGGDADSSHQVVFSLRGENFTFGEVLKKIADYTRTIYLAEGNELVFYPRLHPITRTYSLSPAKLAARYGTSPDHLVSTLKTAGVLIPVDSRFTPAKNGRSITVTAPLIVHEDMKRLEWETRNYEITNSDSPSAKETVHQDSAPAKKLQHSARKKRGKNSPK